MALDRMSAFAQRASAVDQLVAIKRLGESDLGNVDDPEGLVHVRLTVLVGREVEGDY